MLIYNMTYLVPEQAMDKWTLWVKEEMIPFMLSSEAFTKPQVAKVLFQDNAEGHSMSVQFHVSDMDVLQNWHRDNAQLFQQLSAKRFGNEVAYFATVLELFD